MILALLVSGLAIANPDLNKIAAEAARNPTPEQQALADAFKNHPDNAYLGDCLGRAVFLARAGRKAEARETLSTVRARYLSAPSGEREKSAFLGNLDSVESSIDLFDLMPASERKKTASEDAKVKPCKSGDPLPSDKKPVLPSKNEPASEPAKK